MVTDWRIAMDSESWFTLGEGISDLGVGIDFAEM